MCEKLFQTNSQLKKEKKKRLEGRSIVIPKQLGIVFWEAVIETGRKLFRAPTVKSKMEEGLPNRKGGNTACIVCAYSHT